MIFGVPLLLEDKKTFVALKPQENAGAPANPSPESQNTPETET